MKNFFIFVLCPLCIALFSFRDNPEQKYIRIEDRIILRVIDGAKYQPGVINMKFKNGNSLFTPKTTGVTSVDNIISQYSVKSVFKPYPLKQDVSKRLPGDTDLDKFIRVKYEGNIDPTELSKEIFKNNSDILEWVEPEFVMDAMFIPNDPSVNQQYHIGRINCFQAWDINQGDTSVHIGIVDSGSDLDHPDLAANIKYNYADPINNIDDDNNGFVDDFMGWDFYNGDNDPNIQGTGSDHGSHVSGCASQVTNNNVHGSGSGFKVKLRITKHAPDFPSPSIFNSNDGIVYQYQNGAKIINCSFGSPSYSSATQNIVNNAWAAGTVILGSAGNDGVYTPRYPGAYDNVVCVAASTNADVKASFSNYHESVDIIAPGQGILSTVFNNNYTTFDGTSMSTPISAGVVGLIRSKYPSWTPAQVVDRLKLGVDSIYHLNPTYIGMIGTGRVNAFKCLSDLPIIARLSQSASDSLYGNNDGVFDLDEVTTISITFKNTWLAGNNVSLRLSSTDPDIEIVQDSVYVGNLSAYTTYTTLHSATFRVKAKPTCPFDKSISFSLSTSSNAFMDNSTTGFSVIFRQGWATHNINNLKLSVTKDGAVGKKTQAYGNGLNITGYTGQQMLEGGLLIGVSNTKVSDVCRRGNIPATFSDSDFSAISSFRMNTPGINSDQDGIGYFNDDGAGSNKIGVTVRSESFAWNSGPDDDYIIFRYTVKNTSGAVISNMFVGMYSYFTPNGLNSNNITELDTANKIGFTRNNNTSNPFLGVRLLSGQTLNFKAINATEVLTGFTTQEKWDALSNGIVNGSIGPGINCMIVSAGPVNLNNNDSVVVGFAVVKGNDRAELIANSGAAQTKFNVIGIQQLTAIVPGEFRLYQNYPNPFNPVTTIKFDVARTSGISIRVYDIIGREVSYFNQVLPAGIYKYDFDGSDLASGVYFYKLESDFYSDIKKMILLK